MIPNTDLRAWLASGPPSSSHRPRCVRPARMAVPYEDAYSKTAGKPTGAISVTDEIAHDGQYSLKWGFAKSQGKGSKYGRNHYLIINVSALQAASPPTNETSPGSARSP